MGELQRPGRVHSRGYISVMLMPLVVALMLMLAFTYDSSVMLLDIRNAAENAQAAARAGAMELDQAHLRSTGTMRIDATRARNAANDYVNRTPYTVTPGGITVTASRVTVSVRGEFRPQLLPIGNRTVAGTGVAFAQWGVTSPDNPG